MEAENSGPADTVFGSYKRLRNQLRKTQANDALRVIWAYALHLQFSTPMPQYIETTDIFRTNKPWTEKSVFPWELEVLAREVMINSQYGSSASRVKKSLRQYNFFAQTVNALKQLENEIARVHGGPTTILTELHRLAHRQFPWQTPRFRNSIYRYYAVFSERSLNAMVQEETGLDVQSLLMTGLALCGTYFGSPAINLPIRVDARGLTPEIVASFIKRFSCGFSDLRKLFVEEQQINEKFSYAYSSLRAFPLVRLQSEVREELACPLPSLLISRITAGVYYEVCGRSEFGKPFGDSFQSYVGRVATKANSKSTFRILPEEDYAVGKDQKRTIDWIILQGDAALFVECKTKRLKLPAKVELHDESVLNEELKVMADAIVQVYKSVSDYAAGHYPSLSFDPTRRIFPVVVTLEDWFLFGTKIELLDSLVRKELERLNLPGQSLDEMPYTVMAADDFEIAIQVVERAGIGSVMQGKTSGEQRLWGVQPYLSNAFAQQCSEARFLFEAEYDDIFEGYI